MRNIVDSHVHIWNPHRLRYAWLDDLPQLNRPYLPEDFSAASAGAGLVKMIFVECGREAAQALDEVDWISTLANNEPRICGIVAHASLEKGEAARADLEKLSSRPLVKGVRRLLQCEGEADFCLRPDFVTGVKMLADFEFTFDLCIRHEQLRSVTELARRLPGVQFILDHFGKPPVRDGRIEPWATQLRDLAKLPNVSCKISGLTTEANWETWSAAKLRPYYEVALEAFGFDRVLFGGDWPVSTLATDYQRWVEAIHELASEFTDLDRRKLFQTNAEKVYRLGCPAALV